MQGVAKAVELRTSRRRYERIDVPAGRVAQNLSYGLERGSRFKQ